MGNFISSCVDLFLNINEIKDKSYKIVENKYEDKFFRWSKGDFKHGCDLTVIHYPNRMIIFDTSKVVDRLVANIDKLQHDKYKLNYGCHLGIVKDLIIKIKVEPMTDEDFKDIDDFNKRKKKIKKP